MTIHRHLITQDPPTKLRIDLTCPNLTPNFLVLDLERNQLIFPDKLDECPNNLLERQLQELPGPQVRTEKKKLWKMRSTTRINVQKAPNAEHPPGT